MAQSTRLIRACARADLEGAAGVVVSVAPREEYLVISDGTDLYAVPNTCTHRDYWLDHARVNRDTAELICPWHGGRFDLRTGAPTREPCTQAIAVYPVVVQGDDVFIELPA